MLRNVLFGWFALPIAAWGQNVDNVNQGTSYLTIQQAIDDADPGDSLELIAASFNEAVRVDRDIVVFGNGFTILSSPDAAVFELAEDVSFDLSGVVVEPVAGDLDLQGIRGAQGGNRIGLSNATFTTADPTVNGAAVFADAAREVTITNVTFRSIVPGSPAAFEGGAIYVDSGGANHVPVMITGAVFDDISTSDGAVVSGVSIALTCTDCKFEHGGPAIRLSASTLTVERSLFCAINGIGIHNSYWGPVLIRASLFVETFVGDFSVIEGVPPGSDHWAVTNNTFVGTSGSGQSSAVALMEGGGGLNLTNNLFYNGDGYGIDIIGAATMRYNWFESNSSGEVFGGVPDGTNPSGPPLLESWTENSDCDDDDLWPRPMSTGGLIDAGDPSILDPDGSRSDIGAYGGPSADPSVHEDGDNDGFGFLHDCDDTDLAVSPSAVETCNGMDDDCDGLVDDDDQGVAGQDTFYPDCDADGQGAPTGAVVACLPPAEPLCAAWQSSADLGNLASSDCNDQDPLVYLGADELCAAGDQNCDGDDDVGAVDTTHYYVDDDRDGFGSQSSVAVCGGTAPPPGYTTTPGDCFDGDVAFHPGAPDSCGDGLDQDCNLLDGDDLSIRDWYPDVDGDGFGDGSTSPVLDCHDARAGFTTNATDCDDGAPNVHPGAAETCNGIDDDCSSGIDDHVVGCGTTSPKPQEPKDPEEPGSVHPVGACNTSGGSISSVLWLAMVAARRGRSRFKSSAGPLPPLTVAEPRSWTGGQAGDPFV